MSKTLELFESTDIEVLIAAGNRNERCISEPHRMESLPFRQPR